MSNTFYCLKENGELVNLGQFDTFDAANEDANEEDNVLGVFFDSDVRGWDQSVKMHTAPTDFFSYEYASQAVGWYGSFNSYDDAVAHSQRNNGDGHLVLDTDAVRRWALS